MSRREYIAYEGEKFTIEWYYSPDGKSQALDYYVSLDRCQRMKVLYLLKLMGDLGKINDITKFRNEGDQIYAFKPKPDRFLCFFACKGKIIITNAFCKKQHKLPKVEKEKALLAKGSYDVRLKKGTYYE